MPGQSQCSYVFFSPFSSFLVKLMDDYKALEYSPQHQTPMPIISNTPSSYFLHLKMYITTSCLCTTPHPHSHHTHSHLLPQELDTQSVNLMALPLYDSLPPQSQAQQVQLPHCPMSLSFCRTRGGTRRTRGSTSTATAGATTCRQ